jgi:hypothetical protein
MLCTLVMELPKLKDCGDDVVRAAKIKILAPQELAKDCLSDVGFQPFFTKHEGVLACFKRTLDRLLLLDSNSTEKASKVACQGVPGMVVVNNYSVAELLLSTSSPSFACFSSKKSASSLSMKADLASSAASSKKSTSNVSTKPALSDGRIAIRKSSAQILYTKPSRRQTKKETISKALRCLLPPGFFQLKRTSLKVNISILLRLSR